MILVIGGIKGGSGKTTLATNLAVMQASKKRKVLLVDGDDQRSCTDWYEQRQAYIKENPEVKLIDFPVPSISGSAMHSQLLAMKRTYSDIIVDTGGRDTTTQRSALMVADKFLIPFKPRCFDVWTVSAVKRIINDARITNPGLKCYAVINQADPRGGDNALSLKILQEYPEFICIPSFVGARKSLAKAASDGLGIIEDPEADDKAISELKALHKQIYK